MLERYRKKRTFAKTPEPDGSNHLARPQENNLLSFVVQKHAARRLHYDFRLELDGVLLSWAVPRGVPLWASDKRLAVRTEDHPIEYGDFEGVIPPGNYGAGQVIVWDRGSYYAYENGKRYSIDLRKEAQYLRSGLKRGKLSFVLQGEKLKGAWSLIRIKARENDWLLIKQQDPILDGIALHPNENSVISGLSLENVSSISGSDDEHRPRETKRAKANSNYGVSAPFPQFFLPMLATLVQSAFSKEGWFFEPKLDGIRALAFVRKGNVAMFSRRGSSLASRYPRLGEALAQSHEEMVLDGEIVAFDLTGRTSFQTLQSRIGLTDPEEIRKADVTAPVIYYIFDILYYRGQDLRGEPLARRKEILHRVVAVNDQVRLVDDLGSKGEAAFKACLLHGLEGIVGKRAASTYQSGCRSHDWLKVKANQSDEFIVCGYTEGVGARTSTFGALILGEYDAGGELKCVGAVGTGFDRKLLRALMVIMEPLKVARCPFGSCPLNRLRPTWLSPGLVVEIKFAERTKDNMLRAPVFMRVRDDKPAEKIVRLPIVHVPSKDQ